MKHYSEDSKKFIKNVVSLVVSALLLAAATYAWFSSASNATFLPFSATVSSPKVVNYARMTPDDSFFDFNMNNAVLDTSTPAVRTPVATRPSTYTGVSSYLLSKPGSAWISNTNETSVTVSNGKYICNMYPGEYAAYRISYYSDGLDKKLAFQTVTVTGLSGLQDAEIQEFGITAAEAAEAGSYSSALERKILNSIYVYAFLRTKEPEANWSNASGQVFKTLYALGNAQTGQPGLSNVLTCSADSGTSVEMYYVIGMPASDSTIHNIVQKIGATVTINRVNVENVSSGS